MNSSSTCIINKVKCAILNFHTIRVDTIIIAKQQ
jgi:hypothetical protein